MTFVGKTKRYGLASISSSDHAVGGKNPWVLLLLNEVPCRGVIKRQRWHRGLQRRHSRTSNLPHTGSTDTPVPCVLVTRRCPDTRQTDRSRSTSGR